MKVLLMQQPKSASDYPRWFSEIDEPMEVVVFTSAQRVKRHVWSSNVIREIEVNDYSSEQATTRFFQLVDEEQPDRIISSSEEDVLRAAEARQRCNIPGLQPSLAVAFRDKIAMKFLAEKAGVRTIPFCECLHFGDIFKAVDMWGTIVLKPRCGAGSAGIYVLRSHVDVRTAMQNATLVNAVHSNQYYLEPFIRGDTYHVDVVCDHGNPVLISPSRYLHAPLEFNAYNSGSVMLDEGGDEARQLVSLTRRLIWTCGRGAPNIMHVEYYRTYDDVFMLGEMAARRGGGLIKQEIKATYGIDLSKANLRIELGLRGLDAGLKRSGQCGIILETTQLRWPQNKSLPQWAVLDSVGKRIVQATNSVDSKRKILVFGNDEREILDRIQVIVNG